MQNPPAKPFRSLLAAQALFFLNAAIWTLFGIASLVQGSGLEGPARWIVAILVFVNAAGMLLFGWGIRKQSWQVWVLALGFLGANIFLTVVDQFGPLDLATLAIDILLFVMLWISRPGGRNEQIEKNI